LRLAVASGAPGLYEEPLYDRLTWEPVGTPWCRVNYHPDKCAGGRLHEHLVWQKGDQLRRTRINRPRGLWDIPILGYDDDEVLCLVTGGIPDVQIDHNNTEILGRPHNAECSLYVSVNGSADPVVGKLCIEDKYVARAVRERDVFVRNGRRGLEFAKEMHAERHPDKPYCARAREAIAQRVGQYEDWLTAAQSRWNEVQELDQVFIAV
jgi:hypothetical protein